MTFYDKLQKAMSTRDISVYLELIHEDAVMVFHKSGNKFSKSEWGTMVAGMFANEKFIQDSTRCIYENDDILVYHDFMSYPDDTSEAVMGVYILKDGKAIRMESGATSLN